MNESFAGPPTASLEPTIGPYEHRTVMVLPRDPRVGPVFDLDARGGCIVDKNDRLGIARPKAARRPQEAER